MTVDYSFETTYDRLRQSRVEMLTSQEELRFLYDMAKNVTHFLKQPLIVELGTYEAFSAIIMAAAAKSEGFEGGRIVSVDNYELTGRHAAMANVHRFGFTDVIELVESDAAASSELFEDETVDMIFVDAGQEYEDVFNTLERFFPKLATAGMTCRGIFCGHAYTPMSSDGIQVIHAVEDWKREHGHRLAGWGVVDRVWWTIKN